MLNKPFIYLLPLSLYSEVSGFLPTRRKSMHFRGASGTTDSTPDHTPLSLFQSAVCDASSGAVFFAGGPVWSMDWLPQSRADTTPHSQWLALAAYRELDEVKGHHSNSLTFILDVLLDISDQFCCLLQRSYSSLGLR